MPKLSLITLVYNQAPFLGERIRSIRAQTLQDFEWIVLDDCSTDDSAEILQQQLADMPQLKRLILHDKNCGVHPSFNEALSWCEGKYIHHAAGDDSCDPTLFEKSVAFLDANPAVGFVHSAYRVIDSENHVLRVIYPIEQTCVQPGAQVFKRLALSGNFLCSPSVTFHRERYKSVGGLSNDWVYAGDYELWMKFSLSWDVGYISEPLVDWRRHPQAISKRGAISVEGATEVYRVLARVFADIPPEREELRRLYQPAVRQRTTHNMMAMAIWWLVLRRDPRTAIRILKEANRYDPGFWSAPSTYVRVCRNLVPPAVGRLVRGRGGTMDFLPSGNDERFEAA
jgi:glycosyltransferase involved in cell wall biosynthesis